MTKATKIGYDVQCVYCNEIERINSKEENRIFDDRHWQCMRRRTAGLPIEPIHGGD